MSRNEERVPLQKTQVHSPERERETISGTGKALALWMLFSDTAEKSLQTELQGQAAPSSGEERQGGPLLSETWGFLRTPRPAKLPKGRL